MRHNNRKTLAEFPVPDKLTNADTTAAFEDIALNALKDKISDTIYKGTYTENGEKKHSVRERLREIYYNKCAYCEDIDTKPEVEHYRPKKRVTDAPDHPGYYWLCYEWSNLLPSCHYCNTDGGKVDQFPVRGVRAVLPVVDNGVWDKTTINAAESPLKEELPYLLHPEIDHPDDGAFFVFENNGTIKGIDPEGRAAITIKICNMKRDNLLLRRQQMVIDPIIKAVRRALKLQFDERLINDAAFQRLLEMIFMEIKERTAVDQPFSLLALYIFNHFDEIITPLISTPSQGQAISDAFTTFKTDHPT